MKKAAIYGDEDNDIHEHVPLKNHLMKIKQILLIKRLVRAVNEKFQVQLTNEISDNQLEFPKLSWRHLFTHGIGGKPVRYHNFFMEERSSLSP
ncbi:CLUMA_CG010769, isoform A [Clunio marinus]|uniref:CLUMA_CG010769, isoform A n=1 Tax=Clunio marinus TaxID=568069 RepID=A0A1J1IAY9_9DIPT|nr:CLUMA_CG010769, isoform A [Clunio marinus]